MENKTLTKMDMALLGGMAACLGAYIASCFLGNPLEDVKGLIFYFGLGLGLGQAAK